MPYYLGQKRQNSCRLKLHMMLTPEARQSPHGIYRPYGRWSATWIPSPGRVSPGEDGTTGSRRQSNLADVTDPLLAPVVEPPWVHPLAGLVHRPAPILELLVQNAQPLLQLVAAIKRMTRPVPFFL